MDNTNLRPPPCAALRWPTKISPAAMSSRRRAQPKAVLASAELAREWIVAVNSCDLERVLAFYDDDVEMVSAGIIMLGIDVGGCVKGKGNLRAYWSRALEDFPNLHFDLLDVSASPNSVV